MSALPSVDESK